MFRCISSSGLFLIVCFVISVQSKNFVVPAHDQIYDPFWMFSDDNEMLYENLNVCDTSRRGDYKCLYSRWKPIPDTGNAYNNSKYICFNYQFSSDTFYVYDELEPTWLRYQDCRPGFAGFKMMWDNGMIAYPIARYKYLIFAHIGPNQNHKVTVAAWYNAGTFGSISYRETIGTFNSSLDWKLDTLLIPENIRFKNDSLRNQSCYYELLFLITNINSSDTTSGAPGCLKIDDIKLTGYNPIDTSPKSQEVYSGKKVTFKVGISNEFSSKEAIEYQWKKNGNTIQGAINPEYVISATAPADSGVYTVDVRVASSGNTFTSWGATLKVNISSSVIPHPKNEPVNGTGTVLNEPDAKECGCGSGAGLALLPPLWFRIRSLRKKKIV